MINEVWKDVEGFEDKYQISNMGNIVNKRRNRLLKPKNHNTGYYFINLPIGYCPFPKKTFTKQFLIHRLVAKHFILNPFNKPVVNHLDGNKKNNLVTNLEWATYSENEKHKKRVLKIDSGFNNYASKLTAEKLFEIRNLIKNGLRTTDIAKQFGVRPNVISNIKHNKKYKYS